MSEPLPFHYKASFQNSKWYKAPDLTILDTAGKPVATYEYGDGGEGKAMLCGAAFEIKQRSRWWDSPLDIFHGGQAVGSMRFTWNNRLVIQIRQNDAAGKKYLLKPKGFWSGHFTLQDSGGQEILVVRPVREGYFITRIESDAGDMALQQLLLLCSYGTRLIQNR